MKNWLVGLIFGLMLYNSVLCPVMAKYDITLPVIPVPDIVKELVTLAPLLQ